MNKILDPGHKYELLTLDGKLKQTLTFVKRFDKKDPARFPGNFNKYPGTTIQSVLQCLCNRVRYLNNQIKCPENLILLHNLQAAIFNLEQRAAKRHGIELNQTTIEEFELAILCPECGHTICEHRDFL